MTDPLSKPSRELGEKLARLQLAKWSSKSILQHNTNGDDRRCACGYVAVFALAKGEPELLCCYRLSQRRCYFHCQSRYACPPARHALKRRGEKDKKLVHTESAKKRAQRLLKARSWVYRSRVPAAKWWESLSDIFSRVSFAGEDLSALSL